MFNIHLLAFYCVLSSITTDADVYAMVRDTVLITSEKKVIEDNWILLTLMLFPYVSKKKRGIFQTKSTTVSRGT